MVLSSNTDQRPSIRSPALLIHRRADPTIHRCLMERTHRLDLLASTADFIGIRIAARCLHAHACVQETVIRIIGTNDQPGIAIPRIFVRMVNHRAERECVTERRFRPQAMELSAPPLLFDATITFDLTTLVMALQESSWLPFDNALTALRVLGNRGRTPATTTA